MTAQLDFSDFLRWERASRETIDFKMTYVDMAGDLMAGLLLSQIVYWNLPGKNGKTKLRVHHEEHLWLVKAHQDWWDEIRLNVNQVRRALGILKQKGLIITEVHRFGGNPTTHIRIDRGEFMKAWDAALQEEETPSHNVMCRNTERDVLEHRTITETTTENTDILQYSGADAPGPDQEVNTSLKEEDDEDVRARPSGNGEPADQVLEEFEAMFGMVPAKIPRDSVARMAEDFGVDPGIKAMDILHAESRTSIPSWEQLQERWFMVAQRLEVNA